MAKKAKLGGPAIFVGGPRHEDHAKMNVRILGNAMVVQRQIDQKVVSRIRAKTQQEWDDLVTLTKQCPPFPKPTLVKLVLEQLLKVLGLNAWGVGSVSQNAISQMEKDDNLQEIIRSTRCVYARQLKMAWDVKNWSFDMLWKTFFFIGFFNNFSSTHFCTFFINVICFFSHICLMGIWLTIYVFLS